MELKSEGIFKHLSKKELSILNNEKLITTYNKGEIIFKQNTFVSSILFIHDGIVGFYLEGDQSKNVFIDIQGNGALVSSIFLFNNIYDVSVFALKDTKASAFRVDHIQNLFSNNLRFQHDIVKQIIDYQKLVHFKLHVFGTKQMHGRLADTIFYLVEKSKSFPDIFEHLSRKDFAYLTGTSIETIIRLLKELKGDKIINYEGKRIVINNIELMDKLRKIG